MIGIVSEVLPESEAKIRTHELIEEIGMTKADSPFVYAKTDCGATFCQIIMESHVIGKYFEDNLCLEILSCKEFPIEKAIGYAKWAFCFIDEPLLYTKNRGLNTKEEECLVQ